jgi:hypothetical protein
MLSPFGPTAGAGIETHFRRLKIAPEVRYTYWGPEFGPPVPRRSQTELLAGFFF